MKSQLRNYNQIKKIEYIEISAVLLKENCFICHKKFSYFFYFLDSKNLWRLADDEIFIQCNEAQYHQLIVS